MGLNCKNLRELFDAKRANRQRETSEKSLCIFSVLLIDAEQSTVICFVLEVWEKEGMSGLSNALPSYLGLPESHGT